MENQTRSFCVVCISSDGIRVKAFPFWEIPEDDYINQIAGAVAEAAELFGSSLEVRVITIAC